MSYPRNTDVSRHLTRRPKRAARLPLAARSTTASTKEAADLRAERTSTALRDELSTAVAASGR